MKCSEAEQLMMKYMDSELSEKDAKELTVTFWCVVNVKKVFIFMILLWEI